MVIFSSMLFARNVMSFGLSGGTDNLNKEFNLGFYNNMGFAFPIAGTSFSIGPGYRFDMTFSIPDGRSVSAIIVGALLDIELPGWFTLDITAGLATGKSYSRRSVNDGNDAVWLGAGADIGATKYFSEAMNFGLNFGFAGSVGISMAGKSATVLYGSGYLGGSYRFDL